MELTQIRIQGSCYDAAVTGRTRDGDWGGRESKSITLRMDYAAAEALFRDNVPWAILYRPAAQPDGSAEDAQPAEPVEYDNSAYCVAGDITDHRDGTLTVKMGKLTVLEETLLKIYGGENP